LQQDLDTCHDSFLLDDVVNETQNPQ